MIESATMAGIVCVDDLDAPHISRYGLYCDPTNGTFPLVKDRPSRKEAMVARMLSRTLNDFPVRRRGRSNQLVALGQPE
jgi:hypothetical protein